MYVKDANFCVAVSECPFEESVGCLGLGRLSVRSGKPLFAMMSRMVFTSLYSSVYMCSVYCVDILWLRICVGLGGLRSME